MASLLVRNYYILCFNATLPLTFYFSMAFILRQHGRHWVEQGVRVAEVKTSGREFSVEKRKAYLILRQKEMGRKMFKAGKVVDRIHM